MIVNLDDVDPGIEEQEVLFEMAPKWTEHWGEDMPEFEQGNEESFDSIRVHFLNAEDRRAFLVFLGEDPARRRSIWYPQQKLRNMSVRGASGNAPAGRYPVYVISKGRYDNPITARYLERMGLEYQLVVEPSEVDLYAKHISRSRIVELPFENLGQGSIPARNWVWDDAIRNDSGRHWILDDNIDGFYRLNNNTKTLCVDENPFAAAEIFADRYKNVALAGLQYTFFVPRRSVHPPFRLNTRIYSCLLIDNSLPFRWRGRYNEDTDLSLRVLKAGYCTVLLNAYTCNKVATMTMAGGNTDELYADNGRLEMAESLREQHPDLVTVTQKWGRAQHHVDYSSFRFNELVPVEEER